MQRDNKKENLKMPVPDIFKQGLASGWKTYNGSRLDSDLTLEADVAIVGSGAVV
jgi:hypothetical protein